MNISSEAWLLLLLLSAGTFLIRLSFLPLAERWNGKGRLLTLLRPIPAAAMAALAVPGLLFPHGSSSAQHADVIAQTLAGISWEGVLPGIIALCVALRTRNTLLTIGCGLLIFWGQTMLLG